MGAGGGRLGGSRRGGTGPGGGRKSNDGDCWRNIAASHGFSQRSIGASEVGNDGQSKR